MTDTLNDTHDPALRSWVESAHEPGTDFPIQNLPFGVFSRTADERENPYGLRTGVAIGDAVLDLDTCFRDQLFEGPADEVLGRALMEPFGNGFMELLPEERSALRAQVSALLREDGEGYEHFKRLGATLLVPMADVELHIPARIGDYTDFYASVYHATNVGSMFRPDNPLLPNYKYVPIGYHGRASSIVPSGTPVRRPRGQLKGPNDERPTYAPSRSLDYECEVGFFVGRGNRLGEPIPIGGAEAHIVGLCLVNDWSARDIQSWEYQPLGPFLAKNFATTVSPWVVTMEALAPYRVPAFARPAGDPPPLAYLDSPANRERGGVALAVEVYLQSRAMRERGMPPARVSRGRFADMYWTMAQMLAHHASNGCNLQPGDLLASGTVSGPDKESRGCLLELTWRGAEPLRLPTGEERRFLEDGDEVILRGVCEREGFARIGFGECRGEVLPAHGA